VVYVRDMEAMIAFYRDVLGFEVTDRGPLGPAGGPEIVFLSQVDTDHHQLAFLSQNRDERPPNSVDHFAFRVESLADVKEMIGRLEGDGRATKLRPITHGNAWSIYFRDPEGNGIEVFCDSPWHVQQPQAAPWDPAKELDVVVEETRTAYAANPQFGPIDDFYAARRDHLAAGG
jgi:catechol-2,3-dioxygenase